jgi:hypothetical protein
MSFPGSIVLASLAALGAGGVLLAACDGKVLSLGTDSQPVSASDVSGTITPCDANAAHPNVCCGNPGPDPSCVTYPDRPFTPCDSNATTYPDPRSCCPFDGGRCTAPAPIPLDAGFAVSGSGIISPGGYVASCTTCPPTGCYTCPPGYYSMPNIADGVACCLNDVSAAEGCVGVGAPLWCPMCPSGWPMQGNVGDICCRTDPSGASECFSQAASRPATDVDGGAVPDADVPEPYGIGCYTATAGSGCVEEVSGHYYAVNCDSSTNLCSCIVDTNPPVATFPASTLQKNGYTGSNYSVLFTTCGFPATVY